MIDSDAALKMFLDLKYYLSRYVVNNSNVNSKINNMIGTSARHLHMILEVELYKFNFCLLRYVLSFVLNDTSLQQH